MLQAAKQRISISLECIIKWHNDTTSLMHSKINKDLNPCFGPKVYFYSPVHTQVKMIARTQYI